MLRKNIITFVLVLIICVSASTAAFAESCVSCQGNDAYYYCGGVYGYEDISHYYGFFKLCNAQKSTHKVMSNCQCGYDGWSGWICDGMIYHPADECPSTGWTYACPYCY